MKFSDHEFDPVSAEERAAAEREAELARKIRREVVRMQRGEADDDLREDAAEEEAAREAEAEAARRERRRRANPFWLLFTGNILVREGVAEYYRYLLCIAVMFFLSIVVIFTSLHLDMKYNRLENEVQILRERSIRLEQQRYRITTHSAILDCLRERGIELCDPLAPGEIIED